MARQMPDHIAAPSELILQQYCSEMKYRLFIDHMSKHAILHIANCPQFLASGPDDPATAFWSAAIFHSKDEAATAVRQYL
jgi:hypothetical protein